MKVTELGSVAFWNLLKLQPESLARSICTINLNNLEQELEQHPAIRAWVTAAYETARIKEEQAKWELTKIRSRTLLNAKEEKDSISGKAKTIQQLDAEVDIHQEVIDATTKYYEASTISGVLKAMTKGLEDRKDMLIQLAVRQREEQRDS